MRALVHREDEGSEWLRATGAEMVVGEFLDFETVSRAIYRSSGATSAIVAPGTIRISALSSLARQLVRVAGVEPALLAEPDFESGASTNSTTPASSRLAPMWLLADFGLFGETHPAPG